MKNSLETQIPQCVRTILYHSAFDFELSIENICEDILLQAESYANNLATNRLQNIINTFQCYHSEAKT